MVEITIKEHIEEEKPNPRVEQVYQRYVVTRNKEKGMRI